MNYVLSEWVLTGSAFFFIIQISQSRISHIPLNIPDQAAAIAAVIASEPTQNSGVSYWHVTHASLKDMTNTNTKQIDELYVNEMMKALTRKNKAAIAHLLDTFININENTRTHLLYKISMVNDDDALFIITLLLTDCQPDINFKRYLMELLIDKARTNSMFIIPFIDHADMAQLTEAVPLFSSVLLNETDSYILQKIIQAIGETGEKSCVNIIADFIFYDHEELKREAITALGKIGGASAIKRLAFAAKTSKTDDFLQSTLERLESDLSLNDTSICQNPEQFASKKIAPVDSSLDSDIARLIKLFQSKSPLDRFLAIESLIEVGVQAIPATVESMDEENPDSLINGLKVLGHIANEAALAPILKLQNNKHPDSNVRFAAYEAMSKIPCLHAPLALLDGITDTSEQVRIAAATAMNRNPSEIMISGLKSRIETGGKRSKKSQITSAIIDSHSDILFGKLLESDSFVFLASDYLGQCHESTVSFFSDLLIKRGSKSLAMTIKENVKSKLLDKPLTIYCVDSSKICLRYYMKIFYNAGHLPFVFNNSESALSALKRKKPDLITTNFNISGVHGLHLVENIRNIYGKRELPLAVITTQKDIMDSTINHQRLDEIRCLIDLAIQKPLDYKAIKPLIDQLV